MSTSSKLGGRRRRKRDPDARDRIRRMLVGVNDAERVELQRRADLTGQSLSAYLRNAGLGRPMASRVDQLAIRELAKVSGDMGRLGGLMKLWLSEHLGNDKSQADVRRCLRDLGELRELARQLMGKISKSG